MNNKLISIIVPVYNVENELNRCIDSLINQTYKNLEIVLIDDGSTDSSGSICDEYAEKDNRIFVVHKTNGGLSDARNIGIKKSNGDYLMFVDSDDYILDDSCQRFMNVVDESIDIVVGEATKIYDNKQKSQNHKSLNENEIYTGTEYIINSINNNEFFAPVCFNIYRRKFILNNNLFFQKGLLHEDMEILPKLFLKAKKIRYLKYEFYKYIIRENSITTTNNFEKNISDSFKIYSDWKKLIDSINDELLKEKMYCVLSKYIIVTCRKFHVKGKKLPEGINTLFLISNTLNLKEFIKTLFFILFRNIYVRL